MDLGLVSRTAIVTGASRGIGRACTLSLVAEGVNVCAVARDQMTLDQLVADAALVQPSPGVPKSGQVVTVSADLTSEDGCDAALQGCVDAFGGVDILINNAGAASMTNVLELSREEIDEGLLLKMHGYLRMAQRVAPHMIGKGWGRIVNIAGGAGTSPNANNLPTSLANIGVLNITRALTDELAASGILVNVICPGATRTDRARMLWGAAASGPNSVGGKTTDGKTADDLLDDFGATLPAGRIAESDEIARTATFLASDMCSYLYGSALYMDGGFRRSTP